MSPRRARSSTRPEKLRGIRSEILPDREYASKWTVLEGDLETSSRTMLPLRVVERTVAIAGMADSPTTRRAAEMLPCRESNLAVGAPIVILWKRRGLRPTRLSINACRMEGAEDCAANGSSSQEPLMGSSTVNMLTPLVGTLGGAATISSLLCRGDATTIDDEVDASAFDVYAGGTVAKSARGTPWLRVPPFHL